MSRHVFQDLYNAHNECDTEQKMSKYVAPVFYHNKVCRAIQISAYKISKSAQSRVFPPYPKNALGSNLSHCKRKRSDAKASDLFLAEDKRFAQFAVPESPFADARILRPLHRYRYHCIIPRMRSAIALTPRNAPLGSNLHAFQK